MSSGEKTTDSQLNSNTVNSPSQGQPSTPASPNVKNKGGRKKLAKIEGNKNEVVKVECDPSIEDVFGVKPQESGIDTNNSSTDLSPSLRLDNSRSTSGSDSPVALSPTVPSPSPSLGNSRSTSGSDSPVALSPTVPSPSPSHDNSKKQRSGKAKLPQLEHCGSPTLEMEAIPLNPLDIFSVTNRSADKEVSESKQNYNAPPKLAEQRTNPLSPLVPEQRPKNPLSDIARASVGPIKDANSATPGAQKDMQAIKSATVAESEGKQVKNALDKPESKGR